MPDDALHLLRDLLAVLHGDGGHYAARHGLRTATEDAIANRHDPLGPCDLDPVDDGWEVMLAVAEGREHPRAEGPALREVLEAAGALRLDARDSADVRRLCGRLLRREAAR